MNIISIDIILDFSRTSLKLDETEDKEWVSPFDRESIGSSQMNFSLLNSTSSIFWKCASLTESAINW